MSFETVAGMENVAYVKCINLALGASARPVAGDVEQVASPSAAGEEMNSTGALHACGMLCGTSCVHWDSMIALQTDIGESRHW